MNCRNFGAEKVEKSNEKDSEVRLSRSFPVTTLEASTTCRSHDLDYRRVADTEKERQTRAWSHQDYMSVIKDARDATNPQKI